jgi:hypothetical protein
VSLTPKTGHAFPKALVFLGKFALAFVVLIAKGDSPEGSSMKLIYMLLVLAVTPLARSGAIIQPQSGGALNIYDYSPIGQTFTAEDPQVSIGFYVEGYPQSPTTQLTYSLLAGAGTGGTLLTTASTALPGNFRGYADMNFSSVNLTVGQTYTVLITEDNENLLVDWNQLAYEVGGPIPGRIDYTGGELIFQGQLDSLGDDLTFRIEPIPEPGTLAFLLTGCFCFFARSRVLKRFNTSSPAGSCRHPRNTCCR